MWYDVRCDLQCNKHAGGTRPSGWLPQTSTQTQMPSKPSTTSKFNTVAALCNDNQSCVTLQKLWCCCSVLLRVCSGRVGEQQQNEMDVTLLCMRPPFICMCEIEQASVSDTLECAPCFHCFLGTGRNLPRSGC